MLANCLPLGIYYGWARVLPAATIYPMVMSSGWNPHYENEERSVEVHLIDVLLEPFYGSKLCIVVCGYLREEKKYVNKGEYAMANRRMTATPLHH